MQVQGQVQDIKQKTTRAGDMYDIKVNGDYYGTGKYPPRDVSTGDYVEFVAEQNGNFRNVGRGSLRKIAAPANAPTTSAAPVKQSVGMTWDDKQATISKQAALNTAIAFAKLVLDAGAVALPAKKSDQYDYIEAIVMEQAAKFHKFSTGVEVEIEKTSAKKAAKKAAAPADEDWQDDELPE